MVIKPFNLPVMSPTDKCFNFCITQVGCKLSCRPLTKNRSFPAGCSPVFVVCIMEVLQMIMKETIQGNNVEGLIHVSDNTPGFTRKKHGKGFAYYDTTGRKITDQKINRRLNALAIPPAWENVWISPSTAGYLQATGVDSKNRKQYLYHPRWLEYQQASKFSKIKEFARVLPEIRETVSANLMKPGWPKDKVLSLIIGILDETYIRIGNNQYLDENGTKGLTTLRRKNLILEDDSVTFSYKGKSGKYRRLMIYNSLFRKLIRECSELRGYEVFRYEDKGRRTVPVHSGDVNDFLKEITGEEFTSKNFRTWGGTVLAVKNFPGARRKVRENPRLKLRRAVVKEVADALNNTVSVSEKYYIHPAVLEALDNPDFSGYDYNTASMPGGLSPEEKTALAIIEENAGSPGGNANTMGATESVCQRSERKK